MAGFLASLVSCEKKVDIKVKEQAREYPVIFGIVSNDTTENLVTVSFTESFSGKKTGKAPIVSLKMQSFFGGDMLTEDAFIKTGSNSYKLNTTLVPFNTYNFVCTYNSVNYEYSTATGVPVEMDSVLCIKQPGGNYNLYASCLSYNGMLSLLVQVKTGTIVSDQSKTDTIWKNYNERFPQAFPKISFTNPHILLSDTNGVYFFEVLTNCPFTDDELIKIELYSIDPQAASYLDNLKVSVSSIYDPLAISPPLNSFVFSNKALGIIVPAFKRVKIFKLE